MGLLACEDTSVARLRLAFFGTVAGAVAAALPRSVDRRAWRRTRDTLHALAVRIGHCRRGFRELRKAAGTGAEREERSTNTLSKGLLVSMGSHHGDSRPGPASAGASVDADAALRSAAAGLLDLQGEDGGWEGEMTWCPMLTAQYVLLHHLVGRSLAPARRRLILRHFARTRLPRGCWGLHEHSQPYLFVTTLVYVAARLLGARARRSADPASGSVRAQRRSACDTHLGQVLARAARPVRLAGRARDVAGAMAVARAGCPRIPPSGTATPGKYTWPWRRSTPIGIARP